MAYHDRDWHRDGPAPANTSLLTREFTLFSVAGIEVAVHFIFLMVVALELVRGAINGHFLWSVKLSVVIWLSVLLHEFGHCAGARGVGGQADRVLMWPLGGLAFTRPPPTPWANLMTTAAGPAVNLALMIVSGGWLVALAGGAWGVLPLNPLAPLVPLDLEAWRPLAQNHAALSQWLLLIWGLNGIMLAFNLVPVFPLDGGRIAQALLWMRLGYEASMAAATTVGQYGALLLGAVGLVAGEFLLVMVAVFCWFQNQQQAQMIVSSQRGWSAGGTPPNARDPNPWWRPDAPDSGGTTRSARPWFWYRWAEERRQRAQRAAAEHNRHQDNIVDEILAQISRDGLASLSQTQRDILKQATERQKSKR